MLFADSSSSNVFAFIVFIWAAIKISDWMKKAASSDGAKKAAKAGFFALLKRFLG